MPLRNGPQGYGAVTKALHWLTVAAVTAQLAVGYRMEAGDAFDREADRLDDRADRADRAEDAARGRGESEAAEERREAAVERREGALEAREDDAYGEVLREVASGESVRDLLAGEGLSLPEAHVVLGAVVLVLALSRMAWRATTPLPPWAPGLSPRERRVEGWAERLLLGLLVLMPLSGALVAGAGEGLLVLHVATHALFFAALAVHVGLVLRHTVVRRERHLARML